MNTFQVSVVAPAGDAMNHEIIRDSTKSTYPPPTMNGFMPLGMGAWRLFLALLVVLSHLWAPMVQGYAAYAVWGFFVLSGYLMTFVLTQKYGFTKEGLRDYAWNRFLRIMPMYWLALLLGVITILLLVPRGVELARLNPQFTLPQTIGQWLFPLTLLPIFTPQSLPVPVSNALGIEVGMYILMPFLARNKEGAWIVLAAGVGFNCFYGFETSSFVTRYATFLPCSLAFAVGALVCHYRTFLRPIGHSVLSVSVWIIHGLLWLKFSTYPWTWGIYISVFLSAWVVVSLANIRSTKVDTIMGDLSYPVYLLHTTVAVWFLPLFGYERRTRFFLVAFAATLVLSYLVTVVIESPLKRLKARRPAKEDN